MPYWATEQSRGNMYECSSFQMSAKLRIFFSPKQDCKNVSAYFFFSVQYNAEHLLQKNG